MTYLVRVYFDNADAAGRTSVEFVSDNLYAARDALWSSQGMDFVAFHDVSGKMVIVDRSDIQHLMITPLPESESK